MNSDDPGNLRDEEMYDQYEPEESSSSAMTVVQQADEANKESQLDPTPNDYDNTSSIVLGATGTLFYMIDQFDSKNS